MTDRLVARYRGARADAGLAVLEGFHAVKHAWRFGAEMLHLATPDRAALALLAQRLAPDLQDRLAEVAAEVPPEIFRRLATVPPPTGLLALARRPTAVLPSPRGGAPLVLLEAPGDLGNIGAAVRVAAAAGAAAVLTTGAHDPWHPAALRAAAGLHFALPVLQVADPPGGRPVVALDPGGERLGLRDLPPGAVLAFGTERDGLSAGLLARADRRVAIPMRAGVSSLNLATAVAVALYTSRRALPGRGARA